VFSDAQATPKAALMFSTRLLQSTLLGCYLAWAVTASAQAEEGPRSLTIYGVSLEMTDDEIIEKQTREFGPSSERYEFPGHRITHFGEVDCGWRRIDTVPACLHFSVLSLNLEGDYRTSSLVLSQRFQTPLDLEGFKAKMVDSYGEPDYVDNPEPWGVMAGWHEGLYLWSDEFSTTSESAVDELRGAFDLSDAKAGAGTWLRMRLHMSDSGKVLGMQLELVNLTLQRRRVANDEARRREESDRRAEEALENVRRK
jgi:hypothetical protein